MAALVFGAFSLGRAGTQANATSSAPAATATASVETTVQAGESLWSLARRVAPRNDTREVIDQIRRLNDLRGSQLRSGQQLLLPVAGR